MSKPNDHRMERLLRRYVVAPSGCWEWTGTKNGHGYGLICVGAWYSGKITTVAAHKLQWVRHNGPVPDGLNVLHECDNRGCINLAHLFLGTQGDNIHDMMAKGRQNFTGLTFYRPPEAPSPIPEPPPALSEWQRAEWIKRYGKAA